MTLAVCEPSPEAWDTFVEQHPQGHLLQQVPWGKLKSASGWQLRRVAILQHGTRIVAGAQMLLRTRYAISVAYVPRGPLFCNTSSDDKFTTPHEIPTEINTLLLTSMKRIARRHRAIFLRLEPNILETHPHADTMHSWLLMQGLQPTEPIQPRSSIHVALDQQPQQLFASFSKGHRADIRRAERQGITIHIGDRNDIELFYTILLSTAQRAGFGIHDKAYYHHAWDIFQARRRLFIAYQEGQPIAAHMVFADAKGGYYLYSGATEPGLKTGANHLLQWHALQWACEQRCTYYDLWGIPDALGRAATAPTADARANLEAQAKEDPLIGVYRFKKGFGGAIVRYLPAYDQVYIPPLYGLWRRRLG